jgi:hypothetical protein
MAKMKLGQVQAKKESSQSGRLAERSGQTGKEVDNKLQQAIIKSKCP